MPTFGDLLYRNHPILYTTLPTQHLLEMVIGSQPAELANRISANSLRAVDNLLDALTARLLGDQIPIEKLDTTMSTTVCSLIPGGVPN